MTTAVWTGYDEPQTEAAPVLRRTEPPTPDRPEVTIRAVFEVCCDMCGVIGHEPLRGDAKLLRDMHGKTAHAGATLPTVAT